MRRSNLEKLDLEIFEGVLDNGLKIYIVPKENTNGIYATFNTKFGSVNSEFIPKDKEEMVPIAKKFKEKGFDIHVSKGENLTILGLLGDTSSLDTEQVESYSVVDKAQRISAP